MEFLMQPIRGSSFLEEVGESLVPPPAVPASDVPVSGTVVAVAVGLERAMSSAETQFLTAKQVAGERRDSSPPTPELSTGKMNPQAPGWNKRQFFWIDGKCDIHEEVFA